MAALKHTSNSSKGSKPTAYYKVIVEKRVRKKDFPLILAKDRLKIIERIAGLAQNPRPNGAKKLVGRNEYRLRQGKYRILYLIDDDIIVVFVIKVGKRSSVYG